MSYVYRFHRIPAAALEAYVTKQIERRAPGKETRPTGRLNPTAPYTVAGAP